MSIADNVARSPELGPTANRFVPIECCDSQQRRTTRRNSLGIQFFAIASLAKALSVSIELSRRSWSPDALRR